jgi:hypothetical protein
MVAIPATSMLENRLGATLSPEMVVPAPQRIIHPLFKRRIELYELLYAANHDTKYVPNTPHPKPVNAVIGRGRCKRA